MSEQTPSLLKQAQEELFAARREPLSPAESCLISACERILAWADELQAAGKSNCHHPPVSVMWDGYNMWNRCLRCGARRADHPDAQWETPEQFPGEVPHSGSALTEQLCEAAFQRSLAIREPLPSLESARLGLTSVEEVSKAYPQDNPGDRTEGREAIEPEVTWSVLYAGRQEVSHAFVEGSASALCLPKSIARDPPAELGRERCEHCEKLLRWHADQREQQAKIARISELEAQLAETEGCLERARSSIRAEEEAHNETLKSREYWREKQGYACEVIVALREQVRLSQAIVDASVELYRSNLSGNDEDAAADIATSWDAAVEAHIASLPPPVAPEPAEPPGEWLARGLREVSESATPEQHRRVEENPSGFIKGTQAQAQVEPEQPHLPSTREVYAELERHRLEQAGKDQRISELESALRTKTIECESLRGLQSFKTPTTPG